MTYKSHIADTYWGNGMLLTVLGHCDLDLWSQYLKKSYPQHTSTFFFEVTISSFVCGCILMSNNLDLWPQYLKIIVHQHISHIFEVTIWNASCIVCFHYYVRCSCYYVMYIDYYIIGKRHCILCFDHYMGCSWYDINIPFPDWVIVKNIIPRNVIINRGAALIDIHE